MYSIQYLIVMENDYVTGLCTYDTPNFIIISERTPTDEGTVK